MTETTNGTGVPPRRIVIAGASGMIGGALAKRLQASGDQVVRLVRRPAKGQGEVRWEPDAGILDPAVLSGADAVVSLAGAPTARLPWTPAYKKVILESRLDVTRTIADAILAADRPPAVLISGSAVGYYGDRGDEELTEHSARGTGFLSAVVKAWEEEAWRASEVTRVAFVRTGLVVGPAGAMPPLRALALAALAGPIGGGRQWWPWISLHDEVAAIDHIARSELRGPVNLAGPTPATEAEFMRTFARDLHRPYWFPAPAFALRLALQDAAQELVLSSQRMLPTALLNDGFRFRHETVDAALAAYLEGQTA
ncbi:TIGR01777 family oxidoreductase [Rathayibacter sp. KR2-224]|uniref:TIGR01777 family oxidoreductase n=1 Tax=Rathayibacter sp. KR2-224 TaxID=3400913 RepID=UPI003C03B83B